MVLSMYKYCVRCTQCSGRAYPSKEQPTEPNLLRVVCTSCGTPKTWDLHDKPQVEEEILGEARGRTQKEIMSEIELPWL